MAEVVPVRRGLGLGDSLRQSSLAEYHRRYRMQNKDKSAEYRSRDGLKEYQQQYYLQHKDRHRTQKNSAETLNGNRNRSVASKMKLELPVQSMSDSKAEYNRRYYLLNKDRNAEYRNRVDDSRTSYYRGYNLQHRERTAEYHFRNDDPRTEYQQHYSRRNPKKTGSGDARAEYSRQYYVQNKDRRAALRIGNASVVDSGGLGKEMDSRQNVEKGDDLSRRDDSRSDYLQKYYLENKERNTESRDRNQDLRTDYRRSYNLRNREKNADYHYNQQDDESRKAEYYRQYYLQNLDKKAEYANEISASREKYLRHYNLSHLDKNNDYRSRNDDLRADYNRQYYLENKDRNGEFRVRPDDLRTDYQQQYTLGKKEYFRWYFGYQKENQSWRTPEIVREYFESVAARLNVSSFVDWSRISYRQLDHNRGLSLYTKFGSLGAALQFAYPEIKWDLGAFRLRGKKSVQRWLKLKIAEVLPGIDIIEDYQHPELYSDASDRNVELDLWIPAHRIGIEYQGEQHYFNIDVFGPSNAAGSYWERDAMKTSLCASRGVTLIVIPYWWDGSMDSLAATLYQSRPDVFPVSHADPIARAPLNTVTAGHQSHDTTNHSLSSDPIE